MDAALLGEIEKLRRATLGELREKHRELFQEDCRSRNREHVFRRLVWRLQALAEGDLTERVRNRAREIARDADLRIVCHKNALPSKVFVITLKDTSMATRKQVARKNLHCRPKER